MKNNWSALGFGKSSSHDPQVIRDEYLNEQVVILLQGNNMFGNPVYSYVELLGSALREMFTKIRSGENFKPSDFGTVLAAGMGTPPKELQTEMAELYHMKEVPTPPPLVKLSSIQPKFFDDEST